MTHVLENSLIIAVLFIIILIPVSLAIRNSRKQKRKKISQELARAEKTYQVSFQHIDYFDSFIIAMDQDKKIIVQIDLKDYKTQLIDLKDIANCYLVEKKQGKATQLLQLILRDKGQQAIHYIVFYKQYNDNESHLKRSVKTATQWEFMIRKLIGHTA